jgi:hypothetical protein
MARLFSSELMEFGEWRGLYFFELGLALLSLACVLFLKLPPGDRIKAFEKMDFVTFGLFAPGVALLSAVLALGRTVWWLESRWLGYALIGAIVLITAALAVEHNRARPLLNTRWLTNANIARLALSVLLIRVVQSEASGTVGFLQALGLNNDQMLELWWIVMFGAIAGMVVSALTITPARIPAADDYFAGGDGARRVHGFRFDQSDAACGFVRLQFLLGFGGAMFVGPTLSPALAR